MTKRFQVLLVLTSWCLATGVQWDVLQTFAWGRMFAGFAQEQTIGRALASTFAAENVCGLCAVVQQGKQAQAQQPVLGKIELKFLATLAPRHDVVVERRSPGQWPCWPVVWQHEAREAPPVPPPRGA